MSINYLASFKVAYFPNGKSTIWGIYSDFVSGGHPLSKSKIISLPTDWNWGRRHAPRLQWLLSGLRGGVFCDRPYPQSWGPTHELHVISNFSSYLSHLSSPIAIWRFPEMGTSPQIIHLIFGFSMIKQPFWGFYPQLSIWLRSKDLLLDLAQGHPLAGFPVGSPTSPGHGGVPSELT